MTTPNANHTKPINGGTIDRWDLVKLVQATRSETGLNARDCIVFSALVSFLPAQDACRGCTVFPSNKTLSERAGGLSERTLRRAFTSLVAAGMISRNDSSTKKRFPLRNPRGKIEVAYGFDLRPAFDQMHQLTSISKKIKDDAVDIRNLRSRLLARKQVLIERIDELGHEAAKFVQDLSYMLRRKLTLQGLGAMSKQLSAIETQLAETSNANKSEGVRSPATDKTETPIVTATNGQTDRHNKSPNIRNITTEKYQRSLQPHMEWSSLTGIHDYFPEEPTTQICLQKLIYQLGIFLNLKKDQIADGVHKMGWEETLLIIDYIIKNITRIEKPAAYFISIIRERTALRSNR